MESEKEAYYLKANSLKEALKALNAMELSEEEKVGAVALGVLLYDVFKSLAKVMKSSTFVEASDEAKKACLLMKAEEILQKYMTKEKMRKTISPDWVSVIIGIYHYIENSKKRKN